MRTRPIGVGIVTIGLGCMLSGACGAQRNIDDPAGDDDELTACSFSTTQNVYDGPNFWGTIKVKNNGPGSATGYSVSCDVPSGVHCTNDAGHSGAALGALTGGGSSATTKSNHYTFPWATSKHA